MINKFADTIELAPPIDLSENIPCLGYWTHTMDGSDFDCGYEKSGSFGCEDCIINGGRFDPRTGKKYRRSKK